jgi:FkbM family methyltransferase
MIEKAIGCYSLNMSRKLVDFKGFKFFIETAGDHYGLEFWESLENRLWEPDTLDFMERELDGDSLLFDIGAANGSISLIAASYGSQVVAYEPNPTVFKVCKKNLELNPELNNKVNLKLAAVSNRAGTLTFEAGSNSAVITDISIGIHSDSKTLIPILDLSNELHEYADGVGKKIIIKMDIEGAEFRILQDIPSLLAMSKCNAKLLLAIHPGFYRPVRDVMFLRSLRTKIFIIQNYFEAVRMFKTISEFASFNRTNLNPIKSAKLFGLLVISGYHEFIIDFGRC